MSPHPGPDPSSQPTGLGEDPPYRGVEISEQQSRQFKTALVDNMPARRRAGVTPRIVSLPVYRTHPTPRHRNHEVSQPQLRERYFAYRLVLVPDRCRRHPASTAGIARAPYGHAKHRTEPRTHPAWPDHKTSTIDSYGPQPLRTDPRNCASSAHRASTLRINSRTLQPAPALRCRTGGRGAGRRCRRRGRGRCGGSGRPGG